MNKSMKQTHFDTICYDCGACSTFSWILPIIILVVALVPKWYMTSWAKWIIVVTAALMLLKKWCPCKRR